MVYVNTNDLKHILDQIRIAEQHAAGTPLTDLIDNPLAALGLRLVDGTLNNLTPGRETSGSADQVMPRLLDSTYLTQPDVAHLADPNPRAPQAGATSYLQTSGSVFDAEPRVISNLVADQTLSNPAAIASALKHAGLTGQAMLDTANQISAAHRAVLDAQAASTNVDAAISLQRDALTAAVDAAQGALTAAADDVAAKTTAKTLADQDVVLANGNLDTAAAALVAAQSAGEVGPAQAAMQLAQAALAGAQEVLDQASAALATAETNAANALSARDAKVLEIQQLESAKTDADVALSTAQAELSSLQTTLEGTPVPTGLTGAQQAVNTALGNVADAELNLADVDARLLTAQGELTSLNTQLSTAEAAVVTRQGELATAQQAALDSQATLDAATVLNDTESAEAAQAQVAFMSAFSAFLASPVTNFAQMNAAAVTWSAEREEADGAAAALAQALELDNEADDNAVLAQTALNDATALVTSLTEQRDEAQSLVDTLTTEQSTDSETLFSAKTALANANSALLVAQTTNAAYVAAENAVQEQQGVVATATTTVNTAAAAVTAAQGELTGLNTQLTAANDEVTRLNGVVTTADGDVTTAEGDVTIAEETLTAAQAASVEIGVAMAQVATASMALDAAMTTAATAATDLSTAEANKATLDATLDQAEAALAAVDAPGAAEAAFAAAELLLTEAETSLDTLLTTHGVELDGNNIVISDVAPDEGLSAPYNGWMTLFGQFFDHGLDLIGKGGSGTVYIPLMPDDPLYVEGSPTNFMVLTRATNQPGPDGILGTDDDVREHMNKTTPWVDQNQTYTSHASHQVFLREYELDTDGMPIANGSLLHGDSGGMANWGNVKAQAANLLGIQLNDSDVLDGPLLATDPYGNFIPGPNGMPQLVVANPAFETDPAQPEFILVEGDLENPVDASQAVRNGHAFLEDIAHNAVPKGMIDHDRNPGTPMIEVAPDADTDTGNMIIPNNFGMNETYDNELLDRHYIAGDGRGNENFGLTAVHHIFHTEHNRQVTEMKQTIIDSGELAFVNEWLREPIDEVGLAGITAIDDLAWNGERLFQAAKFSTEMQYQHLAFEEFGRRVMPQIAPFMVNTSLEIDGAIFAEFAHVVYRFGHSMLTEDVQTMDADGNMTATGLIEAFLNPVAFDQDGDLTSDQAAGAVARGMSRQTGANIDEFITSALRDNLVGLPLDLAALNIARGRETGVPSLNEAREKFFAATGSDALKPYESWMDYGSNLKNPASVVNFIAAYGAHDTITSATTVEAKRAAAMDLVLGGEGAPADRLDFVNGTGAWATAETGINDVEFWIGGLAEAIMPFGGMLGSSFGFVFQHQMENLQNADRFYYLSRTNGMNMIGELENNSFASMIMRNTDIKDGGAHIPADIFANMEYILEVDQSVQAIEDPVSTDVDPFLTSMGTSLVERATATVDAPLVEGQLEYDNKLQFNGGEHAVLGGTGQRDILVGGLGDDALWGGEGNDLLIGSSGVNTFRGGDGDDILKDGDDVSFLHGEDGNDVISAGGGAGELIFGGRGDDVIMMGADDAKHTFAGMGNDFVLGGAGSDIVDGGEGDDWIEGGDGYDFLFGDNNDNMGASRVQGHDVLWGGPNDNDLHGESGDDILVQGEGTHVNLAELGFDWIVHKDANSGAEVDLTKRIVPEQEEFFKDRYIDAEAVSGTHHDDLIWGDNRIGDAAPIADTPLDNEITFFANELTQEGVDRIDGLREFLGNLMGVNPEDMFTGGNILLGGGGSDVIQGRGGNDVIDGDLMLNVRISVRDANNPDLEIQSINSLEEILPQLLDGTIAPTQLQITREILQEGQEDDVDVAVYYDVRDNYSIRSNPDGSVSVTHITVTPGPTPLDPINGRPNPIDGDGTDRLTNIEILRFADQEVDLRTNPPGNGIIMGTPADDEITGSPGVDVIFGAAGADQINGLAGNDIIFGEAGNDEIIWDAPNGGYDIVNGGGNGDSVGDIDMVTINADGTETAITMYTVEAWTDAGGAAPLDQLSEIIITRTVDGVETAIMEVRGIEEVTLNGVTGTETISAIGDFSQTSLAPDTIYVNGTAGEEIIDFAGFLSSQRLVVDAGAGDDIITGGAGDDILMAGDGDDELTWSVGGGSDIVDGGAGEDIYTINGDGADETFRVYAADLWTGAAVETGTDIVITRDVGAGEQVIGQLQNIEEIQINTAGGVNNVEVVGDFNNTALNFNTISVTTEGDVDVDVSQRLSTHRVFVDAGGTGQNMARSLNVAGIVTEGDVFLIPVDPATLTRTMDGLTVTETSDNFTMTYTVDDVDEFPVLVHSGTPMAAALRGVATVNEQTGVPEGFGFGLLTRGATLVTADDVAALKYMVGASDVAPILPPEPGEPAEDEPAELLQEVRDLEGLTNNLQNPEISGGATLPFMRVTEARYGGIGEDGAGIVNPVFDGLDTRDISNTLGVQDPDAAKAASANMFMMSFGQYFDHGLTFIPKGTGPNGDLMPIEIGGSGMDRSPMTDNPADLTRGSVIGYDEDGTPLHENITSPVVDQNQVYGSSSLIGQLLRESDGQGGVGSKILMGGDDPSAPGFKLMSTLRETLDHHIEAGTVFKGTDKGDVTLQEYYSDADTGRVLKDEDGNYDAGFVKDIATDFMGEGWPLLIDTNPFMNLLDHIVGGDGRANENVGLTSMHTVWARNHNYHVENIDQAGFDGTPEQLFQAARILNIGEYQQVVFNDFADALIGGLQGSGRHGHDKYNPNADARISQEFAAAAYRFGHSQIGETMLVEKNGEMVHVPLVDLFLNPTSDPAAFLVDHDRDPSTPMLSGEAALAALTQMGYVPQDGYAEYGVNNILGGLVAQPSEEVDLQVVDAVRDNLVRVSADLFAFNTARGRDLGLGTLNQVKADLAASTDPYVVEAIEHSDMSMDPYASWDDFQSRNNLSDAEITKFKDAYPDLVLEGDAIAAFQQVNPDITLIEGENGAMIVQGIDRVDLWVGGLAEPHIEDGVVGHTFWVLIHEQLDRLQEGDRFYYTDRIGDLPVYNNFISNVTFGDVVARNTGMTDVPLDVFSHEPEEDDVQAPQETETQETVTQETVTEETETQETVTEETETQETVTEETETQETVTEETETQETVTEETETQETVTEEAAEQEEAPEDQMLVGTVAADTLLGGDGNDLIRGGAGSDFLVAGAGDDMVIGGACNDDILGGAGNDMLYGDAGNDRIFGDDGDDMIVGGTGSDMVYGGAGDDTFIGMDGDDNDIFYGGAGSDTLDLSAMTEALDIRLGNAGTERGSVNIATQSDTIWSIENVIGGSGDDRIVASEAVNVLDGGDGNDTFVFETASGANGTTILGFSAGDVLCFRDIDADSSTEGHDAFTLAGRDATIGAGELTYSHGAEDGDAFTTVTGMTDKGDFQLKLSGHITLEEDNFLLI
ncbi:hypothetical protein KUL25_14040 [Rhodobacteraceae bacterium N5(2021)]|uniref:Heme peroxidase n=1 Tax=Gymnodinialimonas phycosphaerae TaxID=2841589 RepID=A0A975TRY0_9RHOB|nr:peroxidase family protein [Gymnodinialimonas phycosphaerae]MBY4893885.1 hypothetical protein [Gymnodinialimonas phycosphaerae]